jgi:hypothetical protein
VKPHVAFHLRWKEKERGNDVGPTWQWQQPNCGAFSISIYYFITTWPRRHLQPSTLELVASFNINPSRQLRPSSTSCQLHPSSPPTSTLVAIQIPNPVAVLFHPFSLMTATVCLILLLPDELLTKIIIHSIKDLVVFHFLNIRNKICGTFRRICKSDEVLLHVSLRDLSEACKNRYVRSCFERRFHEDSHPEALCFEGMVEGSDGD